jgi:sporadic carbohydrate cluster 2OG-Fe(II) oxygenase
MNFLSKKEVEISQKFKETGYFIFDIEETKDLLFLKNYIIELTKKKLMLKKFDLNFLHKHMSKKDINDFRLDIFKKINSQKWLGIRYYKIFKKYLDILVGNELAMQTQINLSIQMPRDKSSVLPMHADTFNGESPFEVVAWLPLVDCYLNKSMFIVPKKYNTQYINKMAAYSKMGRGGMFKLKKNLKNKIKYLNLKFNQGLIFSPNYLHGNNENLQSETRWSFNTRFKSLLSPYTSEQYSLGKFYTPITMRQATKEGLKVNLPKDFKS